MRKIIYRPKIFYQILIPCSIILVTYSYIFYTNYPNASKVTLYKGYIILIVLFLTILWFLLRKNLIALNKEKIIIKKQIATFSYFKNEIYINNLDKVILLDDVESDYRIGTLGLSYYLKFDYCIKFVYVSKKKDYLLDVGNKINSIEILNLLKNNKITVMNQTKN